MARNALPQGYRGKEFCPRTAPGQVFHTYLIRVTFSCLEYRNVILGNKTLQIDDLHHLDVTESDVPVTNVYVHYLPVEAGDAGIRLALHPFGRVVSISHQHFSGFKQITTGTRIVRMCLHQHIPFQCNIQGFPCRVWYSGQPLKCTICSGAHKAADCPDRNKCRRCHQPGHFAKDCKNAWGTTPPPPAGGPPPVPPAPPHAAPAPPVPPAAPAPPAPLAPPGPPPPVSEPVHVPVPLMSLDVPAPPSIGDVDFPDASEEASHGESPPELFEDSQIPLPSQPDSIGDFSEDTVGSSPSVSSPHISSFTGPSGNCSESILKSIVSSGPMEVEQIVDKSNVNSTMVDSINKGPKVANIPSSTLKRANSDSGGPKEADKSIKSNSKSKVASSKFPKLGPKVVDTVSSDSDSEFKRPNPVSGTRSHIAQSVRSRSQSPALSGRSRSQSPALSDRSCSPGRHDSLPAVVGSRPSRTR